MASALAPEKGDVGSEAAALGRNCHLDSSLCVYEAQRRRNMVLPGPLEKSQTEL